MPLRLRRRLTLALAATALLAGCAFQPIGTFDRAAFLTQEAAHARHALGFLPGTARLAPGEAERLSQFLWALGLGTADDILLTFVSSGAIALDRARVERASEAVRAARVPARLHVVITRDRGRADLNAEIVEVEALRAGQLLVSCPRRHLDHFEQVHAAALPLIGCANAANLARMAAERQDLVSPRRLGPADAAIAAAAVERLREGAPAAPSPAPVR